MTRRQRFDREYIPVARRAEVAAEPAQLGDELFQRRAREGA